MQVKVEKYKGERALEHGMARMMAAGWQIQNQAQRKQMYSVATGVFTKKQIHTVTYMKP